MNNHLKLLMLDLLPTLALAGCGGGTDCSILSMNISPQTTAADHNAPPPGNAQAFKARGSVAEGCASEAGAKVQVDGLTNVVWSVSDTTNVSISNSHDGTFGVATCLGATSGAVNVAANLPADFNSGRALAASGKLTCN